MALDSEGMIGSGQASRAALIPIFFQPVERTRLAMKGEYL
jgi:hypothetical protein